MGWFKSSGGDRERDDPVVIPPEEQVVECPRCCANVRRRFVHRGGHHKLDDHGVVVYCD